MNDATFLQVLYRRHFSNKDAAERFIARHRRQDCFDLEPCHCCFCGWQVTKTRPATQAEIDALFDNLAK